jgi:RHS repeat-associated protein
MRSDSSPDDWSYNIHRGDELALELTDADGLDGAGYSPELSQRYLYGSAVDEILAVEDAVDDVLWGLADHEGTIRDIVDSTGTVQEHRQYDTFGQIVSPANPTADFPQAFTGRPLDTDTGLYDYRARWYDPAVGRFVSEDPSGFAGGDANLYRYAGNSPLVNVDPSGLCFTGIVDSARDTVKGLLENDLLMAAIEVGASFLPGVGEAMDLAMAFAPDSTPLERAIAGISFGIGVATLGMSPNVAPFLRATKGLGKMLNRADDVVDVGTALARGAGRGADDVATGVARVARRGADDVATGLARSTRTPRGTTADKVRRFLADESGTARIPGGHAPKGITQAAQAKGDKFLKGFKTGLNQQTTQIGKFTEFATDVPGQVPGSFTRWVKVVDDNGRTIRLYHDTFDKTGKFIHRGIKVPGPERHVR